MKNNPSGIPFEKPPLSNKEIIRLLSERGMIIDDPKRAEHYLNFISYYRLSVYMLPFQDERHSFKKPISFEKILRLYSFDRRLRLLSMDALERIEVAFRTVIVNCLSEKCGAFWLENPDCFHDKNKRNTQASMLEEIRKQIEQQKTAPSLEHYYQTYSAPEIPPAWIVFEILPFGCVSRIYENLKRPYRKAVAEKFGIEESILQSWFHALSVLRNSCAHHSRIWNRKYPFKIKKANAFPELDTAERFYCFALIIDILLNRIVQTPTWTQRLKETINEFSDVVNPIQMGFPADWDKNDG
ncbi:MAG: Abi family protein [Acetobacter sp.]|nr:Abi family protein [Acetobacter sp.]